MAEELLGFVSIQMHILSSLWTQLKRESLKKRYAWPCLLAFCSHFCMVHSRFRNLSFHNVVSSSTALLLIFCTTV